MGVRTLWRWLGQWEANGLEGLRSEPRQRPGSDLPEVFLAFLDEQKAEDPTVSIPEVIRHARVIGVITDDARIDRTTVWRECRRRGLPTRRRDPSKRSVQRPWRYPHRMQCVIADGKHFKAGARRAARVVIIFLDNASRFVLGVVVGTAESAELTLRGLLKVIRRWGLMTCLCVDLGFDTKDLARATASLGVNLILGTKSYPEARGCIERFNRTLAEQLLCGWPGNPAVDPELMALELRIEHWATEMYNHTPHEGLGGSTPAERFHSDSRSLIVPESDIAIEEAFITSFDRTVKGHNCISVDGTLFELSVDHQGKRVAIHPADLTANAHQQQRAARKPTKPHRAGRRQTAADAAFSRDHPPLVDDDGGYHDND